MANIQANHAQTKPFPSVVTNFSTSNEQSQHYSRAMASSQPANERSRSVHRTATGSHVATTHDSDLDVDSLRSRASSVVSTGTRFSISTLPVEESSHIDGLLGRLNHASVFRPRSVMSTTSYDQPAPPYESRSDTPVLPAAQQDSTAQEPNSTTTEDSEQSPIVSTENSLSMHYSRIVRTIDQNHSNQMRRLKEVHQEELGATRNAIDETYRKELKAKSREVEKMREEIASLIAIYEADVARVQREAIEQATEQAESHRVAMEKACNQIEDTWERRWSDRGRLVAEEARKADADFKIRLDAILADRDRALKDKAATNSERDKLWIEELVKRYPEMSEEMHAVLDTLNLPQDN